MSGTTITAIIPAHTPRLADGSLRRAVESVLAQELPVAAIAIAIDGLGEGAAATRQRALDMAQTEWVAFLDADDHWYPNHLRTLAALAANRDADYCHSWWDGNHPFPEATHRGRMITSLADAHHTTITVLVRTELARAVGFADHPDAGPAGAAEDWLFTLRCLQRGAVFASTPDVTWHYGVDTHNTSGLASRWRPDRAQTGVTVVVPHIPPRRAELLRALDSICVQSLLPAAVSIAVDLDREGSVATRNRALAAASTPFTAFLDDDDAFEANHLAEVVPVAESTGADVVYSGCTVVGPGGGIIPDREECGRFGLPFDPGLLRQRSYLPVTSLVRTARAQKVGGFRFAPGNPYDDHAFYLAMLDAGAVFVHHPVRTWAWHQPGRGSQGVAGNTSGRPENW